MEPKQAWGAFSIIVILADAIAISLLVDIDFEPVLIAAIALIILLAYFYVLYKRYHVEVVPESDIMQFEDPDDLRILSAIYGLDTKGDIMDLKDRLSAFARAHEDSAFIWVAPKTVLFFGSTLEIPPTPRAGKTASTKSLLEEKSTMATGLSDVSRCPICGAKAHETDSKCRQCGSNLEFYSTLKESRVGKRMVSERAGEVRRKPR